MYQITPFAIWNFFALLISVCLTGYGILQYHRRGSNSELVPFIVLLGSITMWQLVAGLVYGVHSARPKLLGFNLMNGLIVLLTVYAFVWFVLVYTGNDKLVNRWTAGIAVGHIVIASFAVAVSPEFFYEVDGLVTQGPVTVLGVTFEQWVILDREFKPPFLFQQLYIYAVLLGSGVILSRYIFRNRNNQHTGQAVALSVGYGTPLVINTLLLAGIVPPELNPTDFALGVSGVALAVAIFRYRLLRLAPVGRQQLFDLIDDPVVLIDDDRRVVDCNPAARQLVDAPKEWERMAVDEFFSPVRDQLSQFPEHGATDGEVSLVQNGTERHFDVTWSPIRSDSAGAVGQLIVLHEITELNEHRQQLQRENERLDRFASMISHDLQNPLNAAQLRIDLVAEERNGENVEAVERSLSRMEAMVEELLELAQAGQEIEATEQCQLGVVAAQSWQNVPTEGAELDVRLGSETVEADPSRIGHVFENLYRNAVEHNDPPVVVRVGLLDNDSGFYVEDDGDGVPEQSREVIFEHGYTSDESGTGFGLSIVKDLVDTHGWTITVTESSGGGARFEIRTA